jgi:hypothetical protein
MNYDTLNVLAHEHTLYADFRREVFKVCGVKDQKEAREYDNRLQKKLPVDKAVVFEPKLILFYYDLFHCVDTQIARQIIKIVADMPDVNKIQWDGRTWVKVDFNAPPGRTHHIEGQETEADRKRVYGKSL